MIWYSYIMAGAALVGALVGIGQGDMNLISISIGILILDYLIRLVVDGGDL